MSFEPKVWFITGCSSGFGRCITEHALEMGDKVIATLRKPEALCQLSAKYPETLLVLRLDVTKDTEVTAAFAAGRERFGRIDVVVNNAGFGLMGEMESVIESTARDLFDVNFWGAVHVTKEALQFFREENKPRGGRLLQVSSLRAVEGAAGSVYYCASKSALESLSEGVVEELHPDWNIKITLLEPGPYRTAGLGNYVMTPVHPAYKDPCLVTMQRRGMLANASKVFNGDPTKFADLVYKVAYLDDPPLRLPAHPMTLSVLRRKGKDLLEAADKWESWTEDLLIKN